MKKILAIVLSLFILSALSLTAFAAASPATSATLGGITIETDGTETKVSDDEINDYVSVTHVHEAADGSELDNIGNALSNDGKIAEVIGKEFEGDKLIQLFDVDFTDKLPEGFDTVTLRIDSTTFTEDMNIILVQYINGKWVQNEHVRAYNGYITMTLDSSEIDGIFGILVEKAPVSPPTGDSFSALPYVTVILLSLIAIGFATRKYLAHK